MKFDFFENIQNAINETLDKNTKENIIDNKLDISDAKVDKTEIELAKKLNCIEEFTIDRFEGDIAVLENRKNKEIKNVSKDKLPENVSEGSIVIHINGKYLVDEKQEKEIENRIKRKMDNLWE